MLCSVIERKQLGSNSFSKQAQLDLVELSFILSSSPRQRFQDFSDHLFQCLSTLTMKTFPVKLKCTVIQFTCFVSHPTALPPWEESPSALSYQTDEENNKVSPSLSLLQAQITKFYQPLFVYHVLQSPGNLSGLLLNYLQYENIFLVLESHLEVLTHQTVASQLKDCESLKLSQKEP